MPILGILASSTQVAAGDFESIATVTVGSGGSSSVEFASIPSTYSHLQVRGIAFACYRFGIQFNSDTAANYSYHLLYGTGSATGAAGVANSDGTGTTIGGFPSSGTNPGVFVVDVLDYANSNKYKTVRCLNGYDSNGSGIVWLGSANWRNTNAVTSLKLLPTEGGGNFAQYSHFALYGIKSA